MAQVVDTSQTQTNGGFPPREITTGSWHGGGASASTCQVWDVVGEKPDSVFFFRFGGKVDQAVFKLMRLIAMIDAVWVPVMVSFGNLSWFGVILHDQRVIAADLALNTLYAACVLVQLRTSIVSLSAAHEYVSLFMIFIKRMQDAHFWLDFLSVFGALWCTKRFPRLIACMRIFRCWRLSGGADDLYELHLAQLSSEDAVVNASYLSVALVLTVHMLTCTWFFTATQSSLNWEDRMNTEPRFHDDSFVSFYLCYLAEGARLMVGWGPAIASLKSGVYGLMECAISSFLAPVTCVSRAWILAELQEVMEEGSRESSTHLNKMKTLSGVLDSIFVPENLKARCLHYSAFLSIHNANHEEYQEHVSALSEELQEDIRISMFHSFARTVPFFSLIPEDVLRKLILVFGQETYGPGQNVIEQGENGTELYFILRGICSVFINGVAVKETSTGDHFGELALLYDAPRAATVQAKTFCMCAFLTREGFNEVLDKEPLVKLCVIRSMMPAKKAQDSQGAVQASTQQQGTSADQMFHHHTNLFTHKKGDGHTVQNNIKVQSALNEIASINNNLELCLRKTEILDGKMASLEGKMVQGARAGPTTPQKSTKSSSSKGRRPWS